MTRYENLFNYFVERNARQPDEYELWMLQILAELGPKYDQTLVLAKEERWRLKALSRNVDIAEKDRLVKEKKMSKTLGMFEDREKFLHYFSCQIRKNLCLSTGGSLPGVTLRKNKKETTHAE